MVGVGVGIECYVVDCNGGGVGVEGGVEIVDGYVECVDCYGGFVVVVGIVVK